MTQISMTGEDWLSDRERSRRKAADAKLAKAEKRAAAALTAAADALDDWIRAYCNVHDDRMGAADGRRRLSADCRELAGHIEARHL
jgi:acetyl-CoA carboxylase alpha subunit